MEGPMNPVGSRRLWSLAFSVFAALSVGPVVLAQEPPVAVPQEPTPYLSLRKTPLETRDYRGKVVEGEERVIAPGDNLWNILIEEKGLSEKHFRRYLVIIGSLNPRMKNPDFLRVGDTLFIPIRPDEILGIQVPSGGKGTKLYRVKKGDFLYKILKKEFGTRAKNDIQDAYRKVRQLNPKKKNWNLLFVGEAVLLPKALKEQGFAIGEPAKIAGETVGLDYGKKLPLKANLHILDQVMGALGNQTNRGGEEVVPLREGKVHLDRDAYPVIENTNLAQKVILDPEGKIPSALKTKIETQDSSTPVVSMKKGASLHEAVASLLPRLGYQSLPANHPVVLQDQGVTVQVKGEWMVAAPEVSGARQDIFIISLTDGPQKTPDYLKDYLSFKGMNLKEILLPSAPITPLSLTSGSGKPEQSFEVESWPREKSEVIDALLMDYQISFSANSQRSVLVREGLRLDTRLDRLFEVGGKEIALLFRSVGEDVRRALKEQAGITAIEMDLQQLSSRQIIARLLGIVGERAAYREHRFPLTDGAAKDKLVVSVSGFYLPGRSMLITDREIPKDLQRFFADKRVRVVYF